MSGGTIQERKHHIKFNGHTLKAVGFGQGSIHVPPGGIITVDALNKHNQSENLLSGAKNQGIDSSANKSRPGDAHVSPGSFVFRTCVIIGICFYNIFYETEKCVGFFFKSPKRSKLYRC